MTTTLLFWIVFLLWLVLGLQWRKPTKADAPGIVLLILIFLLGWAVFGWPIKGGA